MNQAMNMLQLHITEGDTLKPEKPTRRDRLKGTPFPAKENIDNIEVTEMSNRKNSHQEG